MKVALMIPPLTFRYCVIKISYSEKSELQDSRKKEGRIYQLVEERRIWQIAFEMFCS